jgi:hypothetical protein
VLRRQVLKSTVFRKHCLQKTRCSETRVSATQTQAFQACRAEAVGTYLPASVRAKAARTARARHEIPSLKREDVTTPDDGQDREAESTARRGKSWRRGANSTPIRK